MDVRLPESVEREVRKHKILTAAEIEEFKVANDAFRREQRLQKLRAAKKREYARRKDVILARSKAWADANREKVAAMAKAWREANPERKAASTRRDYEKHRARRLERSRVASVTLADSVVKTRFCKRTGLQSKDVPAELVPAIRLSVLIKRELKGKRK